MSSPTPGFSVDIHEPAAGTVRVVVRGELDMSTSPDLTAAIASASSAGTTVLLDLGGVTFLDSSSIGAMVASGQALSEAGSRLQVGPRSDIVAKVLQIAGLAESSDAFDVLAEDR